MTIIGLTDSDGDLVVKLYVSTQGRLLEANAGVSALMVRIIMHTLIPNTHMRRIDVHVYYSFFHL